MKSRKGFTLIELMIVIAIIAIIAAIAIPNLMQSRIRANEAAAVTCVKQYATGQVTFQVGRQGRNAVNTNAGDLGYVDNFCNLYYGEPVGQTGKALELISQAMADAYTAATLAGVGIGTYNGFMTQAAAPTAYQGYQFSEPSEMAATDYETTYALVAFPYNTNSTGNNAYWVGEQGTVYMFGLNAGLTAEGDVGSLATPSDIYAASGSGALPADWSNL